MTSKFQIILPVETTNIVRNPSVEVDLLDWLGDGAAITRTMEEARFGRYSVQVVTNGADPFEGAHVRSFPGNSATPYVGSVSIKGRGNVRVRLRDGTNGDERISDNIQLNPDRWIRVMNVRGATGNSVSNDLSLYVETTTRQAVTFFVDGDQIELGTESTTYIDGDQPGGSWSIVEHQSASSRDSQERSGGRLFDLDEEGIGIYVTMAGGLGYPTVRHNLQNRALLPGLTFQSTKTQARPIMLTFWVRHTNPARGDLRALHKKRQNLIDLIAEDIVSPTQPFLLIYNGGDFPVQIECLYEAGLDFSGDMRNQFFNSFVMRLLCTDPFWLEDNQEVAQLGFSQSIDNVSRLIRLVDNEWQDWGLAENSVEVIAESPDGRIYVGGLFDDIDGDATLSRVAYWDGENWNPLTNGLNQSVSALAVAADGRVYAGGIFTGEAGGGLALERIAVWDPTTETWAALGVGLNGDVTDIVIAPDGQVYVGGAFTDIFGGVDTLNRIARWNPFNSTWNALGPGPGVFAGTVITLEVSPDSQTVYLGGSFTQEFGGAPNDLERIAAYDVAANTFSELGTGSPSDVRALGLAPSGVLFVGGDFTTIGGTPANHIARWNGAAFAALGEGTDDFVGEITVVGNQVFAGGAFREAGGLELSDGFAVWNGSAWVRFPVDIPQNSINTETVDGVVVRGRDIYLVGTFGWILGGETTAITGPTTVVNNPGTRTANPVLEVTGPGTITWLENRESTYVIFLDYTLQEGERLTIDFDNREVVSSWRGNVIGEAVLPQSDFSRFGLLPGDNNIILYIADDTPSTDAQFRFTPQHWSVDAATS